MYGKIRLTEQDVQAINQSQGECWICQKFINELWRDTEGFYLKNSTLEDEGLYEHLVQIIGEPREEKVKVMLT